MRRSRRDYKKEATRDPFQLTLEEPVEGGPEFVTFIDPNKIPTESSFDMARSNDAELMLRKMLSDEDFAAWWAEWRTAPIEETTALLEDVMDHYGADPKKLPR
jgi:hypothetical protein